MGGKRTWVNMIEHQRVFLGLPLFHAANLGMIAFGIFASPVCVLPPPVPLSADVVDSIHKHGEVSGSLIPPSMIVELWNNQKYVANLVKHLTFLAYVGGTLAETVGKELSSRLSLITLMGTTENMYFPVEIDNDPRDWNFISFTPCLGHKYRPFADSLSELVVVRDKKLALFQGVFSTFPERTEYATGDLYEQHSTQENAWVFRSRNDDIVCFSNAEKLNPVTMESTISAHRRIKSAVVGGTGQFQACLMIEPRAFPRNEDGKELLIDELWPTIAEANKDCPAHGRIMRDFIFFSDPERPVPRAGKGSVQRFATYKLYEDEFKAIYASQEKNAANDER